MASARYWRLTGFGTQGTSGSLELSALQLYGAGGRADASATITSTVAPTTGSVANLQDTDLTTTASWPSGEFESPGFAINWDFGAPTNVIGARVGAAASAATFGCRHTLEWFDGSSWQTAFRVTDLAYPGANQLSALDVAGDPYWAYTVLLLPMDGSNGATMFPDVSTSGLTMTTVSAAVVNTSDKMFGTGSLRLPTPGSFLTVNSSQVDLFSGKDYCVEGWFKLDAISGYQTLWSTFTSQGLGRAECVVISSGQVQFAEEDPGGSNPATVITAGPISTGAWHFVRCSKLGTTMSMYIDGVLIGTATSPIRAAVYATKQMTIGTFDPNGTYPYPLVGSVDDFRVSLGTDRAYTASDVPIAALPMKKMFDLTGPQVRTRSGASKVVPSSLVAPASVQTERFSLKRWRKGDIQGAPGVIAGTVALSDTPTNDPVHRKVRLYRDRDGLLVDEQWSDAATGAYLFRDVDMAFAYTVIAYDYEHNFRAVVADNITPVAA